MVRETLHSVFPLGNRLESPNFFVGFGTDLYMPEDPWALEKASRGPYGNFTVGYRVQGMPKLAQFHPKMPILGGLS